MGLFHFHRFRIVRDTGRNCYQKCRCGTRRVLCYGPGCQPIDRQWLATGQWGLAWEPREIMTIPRGFQYMPSAEVTRGK